MKKAYMIIDVEKCEDCNNCFMACKDEHVDNEFPPYSSAQPRHGHRWMNIMRKERGAGSLMDVAYRPTLCMHCDDAPCIKAAQNNAVYKREDGMVIIDPVKSKGQKKIGKACPYNAVDWNEEKDIPQKCSFCAHLLDEGWKEPRCVTACPTGALSFMRADEGQIQDKVKAEDLKALHPEYKTRPRVLYRNLYRYDRAFIAGSIAYMADIGEECAQNAVVTLIREGKAVDEIETDFFGDFKFDGLKEDGRTYELQIRFPDFPQKTVRVEDFYTSINIGAIIM